MVKFESGGTRYILKDRVSARVLLDANGAIVGRQSHLPFGEQIAGSGEQEKHVFTAYERDSESGLEYAVNRGYSTTTGRFLSADPYRSIGYMGDPRSWNRYVYTRNNPVDRVDPLSPQLWLRSRGRWISDSRPLDT
jgi:RHS repeat-associated protein